MTKKEFLAELYRSRQANVNSGIGNFKAKYSGEDDDLAWRLYQVFPGSWDSERRFFGLCILIPHMTIFVQMHLFKGMPVEKIAARLKKHLREELFFHISLKFLEIFVKDVQSTKTLNNV